MGGKSDREARLCTVPREQRVYATDGLPGRQEVRLGGSPSRVWKPRRSLRVVSVHIHGRWMSFLVLKVTQPLPSDRITERKTLSYTESQHGPQKDFIRP